MTSQSEEIDRLRRIVRDCGLNPDAPIPPSRLHTLEQQVGVLKDANAELLAALKYPRFGDTAGLLEKAAEELEKRTTEGWFHLYAPHFRRAAAAIRAAIANATNGTN